MNLPSDLKFAGLAAKIAGVKSIIYRRGMPHPIRNSWLNRLLFKNVLTHVVANSEEIARSLYENNQNWFPKDKIVLVYNGVNTRLPLNTQNKLYEKKNNEVVLGNAGRLTEQKGQKYLIEMALILKNDGINFKLLIAGEGELKTSLTEQIQNAGLENQITLLGHVSDMPAFMNSLDIFVFPSLFEGSANTLIETLHQGIPCVAFDVSSNPEIVQDRKTGLLARPFEAKDLARCVKELLQNSEVTKTYIANGERLVCEKFDSERNLDILQKIL